MVNKRTRKRADTGTIAEKPSTPNRRISVNRKASVKQQFSIEEVANIVDNVLKVKLGDGYEKSMEDLRKANQRVADLEVTCKTLVLGLLDVGDMASLAHSGGGTAKRMVEDYLDTTVRQLSYRLEGNIQTELIHTTVREHRESQRPQVDMEQEDPNAEQQDYDPQGLASYDERTGTWTLNDGSMQWMGRGQIANGDVLPTVPVDNSDMVQQVYDNLRRDMQRANTRIPDDDDLGDVVDDIIGSENM